MHEMIPVSELIIIENAGHFSNLEQPQQFNKALLNFCHRVNF
jgi:pimeloyl-ACP methyl ester carboxylesterase